MPGRRISHTLGFAAALLLAATGGLVIAQVDDSGRGVAPVDSGGSFEVDGIAVDVTAKSADAARYGGWRIAQRKAWQMLSQRMGQGGGMLPDGTLDSIVSGIIVENEQIGPNRYVARLGVLFSRARAGPILGYVEATRSPPMLVIPVEWSGGAGMVFEQRTDWQEAWARFRTGNSAVDYVRPTGSGPDSLVLNVGQTERPGRGWWRAILDQYGASDVLVPVARLYRQWPGGPVIGVFQARHGPDDKLLAQFTMRVGSSDGLAALLDAGVRRVDDAYETALSGGMLAIDPGLAYVPPVATPTPTATPTPDALATDDIGSVVADLNPVFLQVDTPSAASITATEAALRGIPGVRSAITTSLALGGVSVMRLAYDGDPALLATSLESRGWQVSGSGTTLRIRRPLLPSPGVPADNAAAG